MWFDRSRSATATKKTAHVARTYQPRATRFALEVPLCFVAEECRYEGQCINVSASGLLARFATPPELWKNGKVELETGEHYLDIHVRVARMENDAVGFAFCLDTPTDGAAIEILLNAASASLPAGLPANMVGEKD